MTEQLKQALDEPPRQVGLLRDPVTHKWTAQPNCVGFQYTRAIEQPPITPPQSTALEYAEDACETRHPGSYYVRDFPYEKMVVIRDTLRALSKPTAPVRDDVCMCGQPMADHNGYEGHVPLLQTEYYAQQPVEVDLEKLVADIIANTSIPEGFVSGSYLKEAIDYLHANGMIKGQDLAIDFDTMFTAIEAAMNTQQGSADPMTDMMHKTNVALEAVARKMRE